MANMIYTTNQTNSFKIIKSTFNTYVLAHAPVIFSVNFAIFNCFEIPTEPKISDKLCRFMEGGGGGGVCPPAPPEFPPLNTTETVEQGGSLVFGPTNNFVSSHLCD